MNRRASSFFISVSLLLGLSSLFADELVIPSSGFNGNRYITLWTNSPFAIATPEVPAGSVDFQLVGVAQFDGVSYASLVVKQTQEHFVLTSEKPMRNLTLISLRHDAGGASAIIERQGERLVLHEENSASMSAADTSVPSASMPEQVENPAIAGARTFSYPPPRPRSHRPLIVVPPPPPIP